MKNNNKICKVNTVTKQIQLMGGVPIEISLQENGLWLVECPDLEVSTWADTQEGCFTEMNEALQGFFETLMDLGTLNEVMSECGWKVIENDHEVTIIPPFVIKTLLSFKPATHAAVPSYQN